MHRSIQSSYFAMNWSRYTLADYPSDLWRDWDLLNLRYCQSHPMLDSRFVQPLTKHFPAKINILAGFRDQEVVALILLDNAKGLIQLPYLPSQTQMALALLPDDISVIDLSDMQCLPISALRLDLLAVDSQYQQVLLRLDGVETQARGTNMVVEASDSFADYWSQRPKNLRKNITRYKNRISKELGVYEFRAVTGKEGIGPAVERYGRMESLGWKGKLGTALHPDNAQGNFYREVLEKFSESDGAFVFELWVDGTMVASRLCIGNGRLLIILKTTFDERVKMYAFGRMLLFEALKYIFELQLANTVDFYTNASKDQLSWATNSRQIYNVSIYHGRLGSLFRRSLSARNFLMSKAKRD